MKKTLITTLIAATVASTAWMAVGQDEEKPRRGGEGGGREGGGREGGRGGAGMLSRLPIYKALDKDGDGALSEEEIKNASAALLTLDKDKDGKLSSEEIAPAFGNRQRGARAERGGNRGGGAEGGRPQRPQRPQTEKEDSDS